MSIVAARALTVFAAVAPLAACVTGYSMGSPDPRPAQQVEQGDLARSMIDGHNSARRDAGVPALRWDASLAADAEAYAEEMARTRRFEHSDQSSRPGQGENLFMGSHGAYSYAEMVRLWVDERRLYRDGEFPNVSRNGNWRDVAHYTQIVWSTTRSVGCGVASNARDDYLVCRYTPQGNVVGERAFR